MELDLIKVQENLPNVFDCKVYDTVLKVCRVYFGPKNVTHDDSNIMVKNKINLRLSLSWNEQKIYIDTYNGQLTGDSPSDANYCFRLFDLETICNYLRLKYQENEFIRENEG